MALASRHGHGHGWLVMENVLLITLSKQTSMRRTMDVIANNLANMNTTAFKAETVLLEEHQHVVKNTSGDAREIGFVMDYGLNRNFSEGHFEATDNPLNLAISGEGYFVVETPEGIRYTRNGNLSVDTQGRLVTAEGFPLLDIDNRTIVLDQDGDALTIAKDGSINANAQDEEEPRRLQIASFDNQHALKKAGTSLYDAAEQAPVLVENARILQGRLERSNVSAIGEMTKMIETMRAYERATRTGQDVHDLSRKAVDRLGRVEA